MVRALAIGREDKYAHGVFARMEAATPASGVVASPAAEHNPRRVDLTIIIPTLREFALDDAIRKLQDHLARFPVGPTEILVVDDSDDETRAGAAAVVERETGTVDGVEVRLVPGPRLGKGAAVRRGALAARGRFIFVMDADLPVALRHMNDFVEMLRAEDVDGVVGERPKDRYRDDIVRHVLSRVLYQLQRRLVFRGHCFDDTQCGFKAFRADFLQRIALQQVIDGGMVDLEYLYAARLLGAKLARVPVTVNSEVRPSRINVLRCLWVDPIDVGRLIVGGLTGHYR